MFFVCRRCKHRRTRNKKLLAAMLQRGLQQMSIDQHGQHAEGFVGLDETHAAHVSREIVELVRGGGRDLAVFPQIQIQLQIFDIVEALIPLVERLNVNRANAAVSLAAEGRDQMSTDEPARASTTICSLFGIAAPSGFSIEDSKGDVWSAL